MKKRRLHLSSDQQFSLEVASNTGSQVTQEVRPTTIFVLVLEALLALPELLLQLREVELTDGGGAKVALQGSF
jgi:hypothetical protein